MCFIACFIACLFPLYYLHLLTQVFCKRVNPGFNYSQIPVKKRTFYTIFCEKIHDNLCDKKSIDAICYITYFTS